MNDSAALQKLMAHIEIGDQLKRYCYFFDSNDVTGLRTLFTKDAEVDYGPEVPLLVGLDTIINSISKGLAGTFIATSHHLSNLIIELDNEENAHSSSYVYAWHSYYSKPEIGYLWGQYSHTFRKDAGIWKISTLKLRAVATQNFHREIMHPVERKKS